MKHLFIVNPRAGGVKGKIAALQQEIAGFAESLSDPHEVYLTQAPMDACRKIIEDSESEEMLYVYACGGDGTLNECANGAANRPNVAITHYPCGTGNDFIKMFGKENVHLFRDLGALSSGTVRPLDLIDCDGRYGLDICSVGIDARIGCDVHKYSGIPLIGGVTGYIVSLVVNLIKGITQYFRISCGGAIEGGDEPEVFTSDGEITLACCCNGRFYGGGFNPVPDAMPDDGVLDCLIVKPVSRLKVLSVVGKYSKGRFRDFPDIITHIRGTFMEIEGDREFVVNIDGEAIYAQKISFRLIPKGINFIFPALLPFFEGRDPAPDSE